MKRGALFLTLAAALALAADAGAAPGKIAVGLQEGVSAEAMVTVVEAATGGVVVDRSLIALDALVVSVADVDAALGALGVLPGIEYLEHLTASRSLSFVPNDPLFPSQWYIESIRAFDFWEANPAPGPEVLVAVIDSGIDATHPEFANRIADGKSFVGNPRWDVDTLGHGTMVAGLIGATTDNGEGIAGVGLSVRLLIAKVTGPGNSISPQNEAKAIKWAVAKGARVINLSLGAPRNPLDTSIDTYSALEQKAIDYAYSRGVVVVAATGNCSFCPNAYADYPAALPHVLGVSALTELNALASFSNFDPVFNDLIAPGDRIVSTFPFGLSDSACTPLGYSPCAANGLKGGSGTSFAAPLVSAAAALVHAVSPIRLDPSQVIALLERTATDRSPAGRDARTGNGLLNVSDALVAAAGGKPPPTDRYETNDDAGADARTVYGARPTLRATIDYFDDPSDVYRVYLRAGQRLRLRLSGPSGKPSLVLWRPGVEHVTAVTSIAVRSGRILVYRVRHNPGLTYRASRSGWHFVEVKAPKKGGGAYTLSIAKTA